MCSRATSSRTPGADTHEAGHLLWPREERDDGEIRPDQPRGPRAGGRRSDPATRRSPITRTRTNWSASATSSWPTRPSTWTRSTPKKIKGDPRLPFGPRRQQAKKVSNANYLWLSYFYAYLNETGRAGVVMSSQASSAGRDEAKVRKKLIETGAVDVMIDVRGNFFYTRTVPCQLWFFDRAKEQDKTRRDQVLMLDARSIYRQVTRAICDFSPEQQKNIAAIIWLHRSQQERFLTLVQSYLARAVADNDAACAPLRGLLMRRSASWSIWSSRLPPWNAWMIRWPSPGRTLTDVQAMLAADVEAFEDEARRERDRLDGRAAGQ